MQNGWEIRHPTPRGLSELWKMRQQIELVSLEVGFYSTDFVVSELAM
jgi:hypothetical protein